MSDVVENRETERLKHKKKKKKKKKRERDGNRRNYEGEEGRTISEEKSFFSVKSKKRMRKG